MQEHVEAMVKSLVAVAWVDGRVGSEESEVIEALLAAFEVGGEDAERIRQYARTPRTLDDIDLSELSAHDRRMLLQHAVVLTFVDGQQSEEEKTLLRRLADRLHIPEAEARTLIEAASERARRLVSLL
ncbi:MAG: TerB family tellurite resistance protein [Myxococcota bacterium]|nr:TerB family tellurite resistance protein [Myxococcota bacterium]MDW8362757.1 hypothetical protein [Myxococcales bacterium]